jgi:DNA repair exonuclease SbcCD ATPase subunit
MIHFKSVSYKNFLSVGDKFITVNLDQHPTTLVIGKNGGGKSLLTDAISFALYGKAYRKIKKDQLVNTINERGLEVKIEFSIGATQYLIHRGIKPNIFKIYKNGKLVDESSHARDYQANLEQNVLKMNQRAFNQIVILGSAEYTPFMQLPTWHRREVIEELLDIRIFSHMKAEIKGLLASMQDERDACQKEISHTNTIIKEQKSALNQLQRIREEQNQNIEEKRRAIQRKIDDLYDEIDGINLNEDLVQIKKDLMNLERKQQKIQSKMNEAEHKIVDHSSTIKFYQKNSACPTCNSRIDEETRKEKIARGKSKVESLKGALNTGTKMVEQVNAEILKLDGIIKDHESALQRLDSLKRRIKDYRNDLDELGAKNKKNVSDGMVKRTRAEIENLYTKREKHRESQDKVNADIRHYDAALEMLKDTGIKQKVISQYLPVMNQLINKYLEVFDFFVLFTLDSDFNETIRSRHRDKFSYSSFSEGEKARINLALMFCWREIARIKNSAHTNLLIFDETLDQSLDNDGVENLMTVIQTIVDKSNIIVISHRAVEESAFDRVLEAKKVKNFSTLKEAVQ